MQSIQKHTDRCIRIRQRPPSRTVRQSKDTFLHALSDNVHAVVTFVSGASVESVLHDIPVISLGPSACTQVSPWSIETIDQVPNIDLSYSQFTSIEMSDGTAWRILNE